MGRLSAPAARRTLALYPFLCCGFLSRSLESTLDLSALGTPRVPFVWTYPRGALILREQLRVPRVTHGSSRNMTFVAPAGLARMETLST